jgi:hypothetical protein
MKILIIEPGNMAHKAEIGSTLKDMQEVVGGLIEAIYPFEEPVALICNEEGKINGLPLNRALTDESGNICEIIAGIFFICALGDTGFDSLSPELMEKFKKMFHAPEIFFRGTDEKIYNACG